MHSIAVWKLGRSPNYETNIDYQYPYSEVPYLGEYKLVKLPSSLNILIEHVDYWGEGKIKTELGNSGFSNCYNVNHQYQLVSNGPDRDKKIPNRIPVPNYTDCDTSSYIKENSVVIVTLMGAPINSSCAKDIARIVNNDLGKVIIYGFDGDAQDIKNLEEQLNIRGLFHCSDYKLSDTLQSPTLFDNFRAYINVSELNNILYEKIINSAYVVAVGITKKLSKSADYKHVIGDVVIKLLNNNQINIMPYAYKLWHGGHKDVVQENFPIQFKLIYNEDDITITNKQYKQALKLDAKTDSHNDRLAWGDSHDKTSKRVCWRIIPIWDNNNVMFKLYNVDYEMYLNLDANADSIGDRKAWGSANSDEVRHKYYLKPLITGREMAFYIINCQYNQGLKLAVNGDSVGDRPLWGHNGSIYSGEERFRWVFAAWSQI